jgi:hypothetical protein
MVNAKPRPLYLQGRAFLFCSVLVKDYEDIKEFVQMLWVFA